MTYPEFLAAVREGGDYPDREAAARISDAVLGCLGRRLQPEAACHLAEQLPAEVGKALSSAAGGRAETWGVTEFVRQVAAATGDGEDAARGHADVVLGVLARTVAGGELNKLISQLPSGYAGFLGHAELR
ncbi:DUF2267 domain-containing protein [Streptomyces sp. A7024]|uniref:DUF2267 domain-containing protein n=1 Tax=Streptomyces coryli TaxID=1128680 RepID=A0A6G4UDC8_9ACTN|nr:DUF2267 domain-containing protein [Streptomyces coryli]NGN69676.1 DUF2267 domain-containing protein [Streptomyces coryli]